MAEQCPWKVTMQMICSDVLIWWKRKHITAGAGAVCLSEAAWLSERRRLRLFDLRPSRQRLHTHEDSTRMHAHTHACTHIRHRDTNGTETYTTRVCVHRKGNAEQTMTKPSRSDLDLYARQTIQPLHRSLFFTWSRPKSQLC